MKKKIIYFVILFSVMVPFARASGEPSSDELSLEQALRIAFVQNPQLNEARKEIEIARGKHWQAEALPDPNIEFDVGELKSRQQEDHSVRGGHLDSFSIQQPLDPLGTRWLNASIARDDARIARGEFKRQWSEIREQVIAAYYKIVAGEKELIIGQENLDATKQFLGRVETKFQSGGAPRSDVLRAKIEVSRSENELLIIEKELKIAKGELNLALGRSVDSALRLSDQLDYEPMHVRYETILSQALIQRSDLSNERIGLKSKNKNLLKNVLSTLPKPTVGFQRLTQGPNQGGSNDTTLTLSFSAPVWGLNAGAIKEAKAEKDQQEIRLKAFSNQVGLEVYSAFLEAELADKQVNLQKGELDEANELLRQITLKYEEGEIPFISYLENIITIKGTRTAYFEALRNYKEKLAGLETVAESASVPAGNKS